MEPSEVFEWCYDPSPYESEIPFISKNYWLSFPTILNHHLSMINHQKKPLYSYNHMVVLIVYLLGESVVSQQPSYT